jgi:hypothetical protein
MGRIGGCLGQMSRWVGHDIGGWMTRIDACGWLMS